MWSYEIENINTKERDIIFGYNLRDAFRRHPNMKPGEWEVLTETYED